MKSSDSKTHPRSANSWFLEGKRLFDGHNYKEAIHCFENAISLAPEYEHAWHKKAICEERLMLAKEAIRSYQRLLEILDDDDRDTIQHIVWKLSKLQNENKLVSNDKRNPVNISKLANQTTEPSNSQSYKMGDIIGQEYEVLSILGQGGFGVVYLVRELRTNTLFALKTILNIHQTDMQTRERFRKEANLWVDLGRHPYLVRAYVVQEFSNRLFIVMEFIPRDANGMNSLVEYLQRGQPSIIQSLRWAIQICHGMEHAYSRGVRSHRDLKPENILISQDGRALVTDFGLAGTFDSSLMKSLGSTRVRANNIMVGKTQKGLILGTPTHMPPEQFEDITNTDERTDIYAFGIILFQMVSGGYPPFQAVPPRDMSVTESERYWSDIYGKQKHEQVPALDSPLDPVIKRCLEKLPNNRFQSFKELRLVLEILLKSLNGGAVKTPELYDLDAEDLNYKGLSLVYLGRNEEALYYFDQAIESVPTEAVLWNNKGTSLSGLGMYEDAIQCYEKAIALLPDYAHAWSGKGICMAKLNRHVEAQKLFSQALSLDPQNSRSWHNLGTSFQSTDRHADAAKCFEQAVKYDPGNAGAWLSLGISLTNLSRFEESLVSFDRALEIDPLGSVWYPKGLSLFYLKRFKEAIDCFQKALAIEPRSASCLYFKGLSLQHMGNYQNALACYDQAVAIDPMLALAWHQKGSILTLFSNPYEAIRCFDRVLAIDQTIAEAWSTKGICLGTLALFDESLSCFDQALKLKPDDVNTWYSKGVSLRELGRNMEAIQCFERAIQLDPQYDEPWINNAQCLLMLGRYKDALNCCNQALSLHSLRVELWFNRATAEENLGRTTDAIRTYQQFIKMATPDHAEFVQLANSRIRNLTR